MCHAHFAGPQAKRRGRDWLAQETRWVKHAKVGKVWPSQDVTEAEFTAGKADGPFEAHEQDEGIGKLWVPARRCGLRERACAA